MSAPPVPLRGVYVRRLKRHAGVAAIASVITLAAVLSWRENRKKKFQTFYA